MIGVFDSGVGGLSVLSAIRTAMPDADLLYAADQGRAPYGPRPLSEVENISHDVARWLIEQGADTLVVACNTASTAALHSLRASFDVPIVGMEPAVKPAASVTQTGVVGVVATAATFQGELFASVVDRHAADVTVVTRACPEWVELVEEGTTDGPVAEDRVETAIHPMMRDGVDTLVLGCTHFSFLADTITAASNDRLHVIDPANAVAAQTGRVAGQLTEDGRLTLATSGSPEQLRTAARKLISVQVTEPVLLFGS